MAIRDRGCFAPLDEGIVVHYGVPNHGARAVARRVARRRYGVPLGVNLVETNTGMEAAPKQVVDQFVEAASVFCHAAPAGSGRCDYLALNLNCPNTSAGQSTFDDVNWLGRMLDAYARIDNLPPVFLKLVARADLHTIDRTLETIAGFDFVRGFIFNLPPGKPYRLRTSAKHLAAMPGVASGPHTRLMIDATIRAWYRRMDRNRYAIIGVGGGDDGRPRRLPKDSPGRLPGAALHGAGVPRPRPGACDQQGPLPTP